MMATVEQPMPQLQGDKSTLFDWLLNRHVHEYFDVDGRPVGEGRSLAYAEVETLFRKCPYPGSRYYHPYPMNDSALQSIIPKWQKILSLLAFLGQRYQILHGKPVETYYDLALISSSGVFLTDHLILRRSQPLTSNHIPVLISGLYKVCAGFQQATFMAMMNDWFKTDEAEKILPDAKGFYDYLEQQSLLIGEDEVCGGSEAMISKAYELMKAPVAESVDDLESLPKLPELESLKVDWRAYDQFAFHSADLWREAILFVIQMRDFGIELNNSELPGKLRADINTYFKTDFEKLLTRQSGLAVEIARLTLEKSGHSLADWFGLREQFLTGMGASPMTTPVEPETAGELAGKLVQQLASKINLSCWQALVRTEIHQQLTRYEAFETAVLQSFNQHLGEIQTALGYEQTTGALRSADLSALYGKTVFDLCGG